MLLCKNKNNLNQWQQQTFIKVSSFDALKQKIILPINHSNAVEHLIEQNVDPFAEKDTDFRKTNTIKMSIDTCNQPPYKTSFAKHPVVDSAVNGMWAANICPSKSPWSFPYSSHWQKE